MKTKKPFKSNLPPGPGPGRPKGLKNKLPLDLKKRVFAVWDQLEAEGKGLESEARKKPLWFYENFLKPMLPKNVDMTHNFDEPLIEIVRKLRAEKNAK